MLINRPKQAPQPWRWPEGKTKPRLPAVHLPHFRVNYRALEEYVTKVYRMAGFDFFIATGLTAGMVPEYRVTGKLPPAWEVTERAEQIRHGRKTRDVQLILDILCLDGFIPAGIYYIDTAREVPPIEQYRALLVKTTDPLDPQCGRFREQHRHDREFMAKAAMLDSAVLEYLKSVKKPSC